MFFSQTKDILHFHLPNRKKNGYDTFSICIENIPQSSIDLCFPCIKEHSRDIINVLPIYFGNLTTEISQIANKM